MHAIPSAFDLAFDCIIFFPAIPSVPERSRAAGSEVPKGQSDSKEKLFNEIRTERVVAGATCKDKCTQINRGSSAELKHSSRRSAAEVQIAFAGHRTQPVSNGLLCYNWAQGVDSMST